MKKLISMTDFVTENHEKGIELIKSYSEFLNKPLEIGMFESNKPLFPSFKISTQREALRANAPQCVSIEGDKISITLYRKSRLSNQKSGMCYMTHHGLTTVEDLCDKDISYSTDSDYLNDVA